MSTSNRRSSDETDLPDAGYSEPIRDLTGVTLGDFRIEKLLGSGGMGEVYMATQLSLSRPVALKVLRPNLAANPTYLGRLKTEATAVAKLNHPNIVHVYTFGGVDQISFIAMEYVQGTNLKEYILKKGALDIPLAFSIMRQTGQAIGAAGEIGLVHRDVKPENILMTKKGRVKVADFGLCRDEQSERVHLTQSGVTMGTPLYMSPEQAQGHAIDHRSDLYSLGVTFYHMLAGVPPFHAETALALALKQVRENPRSMLIHRPDLPVELDKLVLKLMAKDPRDRYQSAAEMLADLARARDSLQVGSTAVMPDTFSSMPIRADDSRASTLTNGPAPKTESAPRFSAVDMVVPVRDALARLSPRIMIATSAACLVVGALAGWSARDPDVLALPTEATSAAPALWLEPRWTRVPQQKTAEEQLRYALLQAPADEWAPAFLAVAGYFRGANEVVSKAYIQLARIWYRDGNLEALGTLESELLQWPQKKERDKALVDSIRTAILLKKGDLEGTVKGMKSLVHDDVPDMFDPGLVELNLEVCSDAMGAANRAGNETMRGTFQPFWTQLMRRLYRIERPGGGRPAGRPNEKNVHNRG
jgi:eukaryotic-like serine/threonine-protein kinase